MKTKLAITLLLASILSAQPAITNQPPDQQHLGHLPIIVLIAAVAGTLLIVKVYNKNPGGFVPRLCLEKSTDRATWSVVCCRTNVILNGTNPITVFTEEMTDTCALYRAKCYPQ